MRYFITFACYGNRLHGTGEGSVDPKHNQPGSPLIEAAYELAIFERQRMAYAPYSLDTVGRALVLDALQEVCKCRGWTLLAAHVRSNHVHAIVDAELPPELVMNSFNSYASRSLNARFEEERSRKRWARHVSTRWLWKDKDVDEAIRYVIEGQGEPMAFFVSELV